MVRSLNVPVWMGPLLLAVAFALIPLALVIGLSIAALVSGFILVCRFMPAIRRRTLEKRSSLYVPQGALSGSPQVLEAEFEVKDVHEKN